MAQTIVMCYLWTPCGRLCGDKALVQTVSIAIVQTLPVLLMD